MSRPEIWRFMTTFIIRITASTDSTSSVSNAITSATPRSCECLLGLVITAFPPASADEHDERARRGAGLHPGRDVGQVWTGWGRNEAPVEVGRDHGGHHARDRSAGDVHTVGRDEAEVHVVDLDAAAIGGVVLAPADDDVVPRATAQIARPD